MKKLFVFAIAFIAFTSFSFSDKENQDLLNPSAAINKGADHEFSYFRIHRQAKNVVLNWGLTTSAGVTGFTIQRSYDGEFFEEVNQAPSNNGVKFSWKDENVFPGYIYYKVGCMMSDGSSHFSEVEVIRIVSRG